MIIGNLVKKLEKTPEVTELKITAERARWGGWNVKLYCLVGGYYDVSESAQVNDLDGKMTEEEAIEAFKLKEVRAFHAKAWHDESDSMSDYFAGFFNERLKDVDWLVQSAKGQKGKYDTAE